MNDEFLLPCKWAKVLQSAIKIFILVLQIPSSGYPSPSNHMLMSKGDAGHERSAQNTQRKWWLNIFTPRHHLQHQTECLSFSVFEAPYKQKKNNS